jgi:hypothetical protein
LTDNVASDVGAADDEPATVRLDLAVGASVAVILDAESGPVRLFITAHAELVDVAAVRSEQVRTRLHAVDATRGATGLLSETR